MSHPVPATLASATLNQHRPRSSTPTVFATGCKAIDHDALSDGGLERGRITALSGGPRTGKTLLAMHTIATALLARPDAQAAIIDTTGSFSAASLRDVVAVRLNDNSDKKNLVEDDVADDARIFGVLDRVKVMRVWDFYGMTDAVGELRGMLDAGMVGGARDHHDLNVKDDVRAARGGKYENGQSEMIEVADSDGDEDEDDEMAAGETDTKGGDTTRVVASERICIVVVDTITSTISPLLSSNMVQGATDYDLHADVGSPIPSSWGKGGGDCGETGHALLVTFTRNLSLLTEHHQLMTLLLNNTVSSRRRGVPAGRESRDNAASPDVSIFASTAERPALGRTLGYCVDTHLLLSTVPREGRYIGDATSLGGEGETVGRSAVICEVLEQRYGAGKGRWGAFAFQDGVRLRSVV
ncbi:MAG: hypothetical protein M1825_006460 [Sarcosagium campestre]|nr:MAG: hypothetical protein M1825_006460 [Sarcosagium campestre]